MCDLMPIPGHMDYYINRNAEVWSNKCNKWRKLTPAKNNGYLHVKLDYITERIHCLMLTTFVGPRPDGMVACHNDGDRLNNDLSNLRWDTVQSNVADLMSHGTHRCVQPKDAFVGYKLTSSDVKRIIWCMLNGHASLTKLAQIFNVSPSMISKIKTKRHWAWVWEELSYV